MYMCVTGVPRSQLFRVPVHLQTIPVLHADACLFCFILQQNARIRLGFGGILHFNYCRRMQFPSIKISGGEAALRRDALASELWLSEDHGT